MIFPSIHMCAPSKCFSGPRVWCAVKRTPKWQWRKPGRLSGNQETLSQLEQLPGLCVRKSLHLAVLSPQILSLNHGRRWMLHSPAFAWTLHRSSVQSDLWQDTGWARLDLLNKMPVGWQGMMQSCLWRSFL